MENSYQETLADTDPEYNRLHAEHQGHEHRLRELASRPHLSEEEELEEKRLKKEKLLIKDRMEAIARHHRPGVAH